MNSWLFLRGRPEALPVLEEPNVFARLTFPNIELNAVDTLFVSGLALHAIWDPGTQVTLMSINFVVLQYKPYGKEMNLWQVKGSCKAVMIDL